MALDRRIGMSAIVLLLVLAAALFLASPATASTPSETWSVSSKSTLREQTLTVTGEIRVESGATLEILYSTVTIAPGSTTAPALIVEKGGTLVVRNSVIQAQGGAEADAVSIAIKGYADIRSSTLRGLAADAQRSLSAPLAGGMRLPYGGVILDGSDAFLDSVTVESAVGCAVTSLRGSPSLANIDAKDVAYRADGSSAYAAALCVDGGGPSVNGLRIGAVGTSVPSGASSLYAVGVLARAADGLEILSLDTRDFIATPSKGTVVFSAAVVLEDPVSAKVRGGSISGSGYGILINTQRSPSGGSDVTLAALSIVNTPSAPISETGTFTSPTTRNWANLTINATGSPYGLYFESYRSSATVDATVDNVTVTRANLDGIYLFANQATGSHTFYGWTSNASLNGRNGIRFGGSALASGFVVRMAGNGAYRNAGHGIFVEAGYTSINAIASSKLEWNMADNNSQSGIYQTLGVPATQALRYVYNTARGNGVAGFVAYYGHFIDVRATNSFSIIGNTFPGLVARNNSHRGVGLIGSGAWPFTTTIIDSLIAGHPTGIYAMSARIEIRNSTMNDTTEFEGALPGASFYIYGSPHTRLTGATVGTNKIESYKLIDIHTTWQNGAPLQLIPLRFLNGNNTDAAIYSDVTVYPPILAQFRQTDTNGNWSGWMKDWEFDPQLPSADQRKDYAPLTIIVQLFETSARSAPLPLDYNIQGVLVFLDPNPPTLIISSPRENGTYTVSNLTVSGSVSDDLSGVAALEVSLDGANWTRIPGVPPNSSFSFGFQSLPDGVYDIFIRAWDKANDGPGPIPELATVTLYSITLDTIAPAITLTVPRLQDGDSYTTSAETLLLQGTVDRSVRQLFMNGQVVTILGTVFIISVPLPNEGPQSFSFLALDAAGNTRTLNITVIRDQVSPTLIVIEPAGQGDIYLPMRTVVLRGITDANAVVSVNGVPVPVLSLTFQTPLILAEGRNVIVINATDAAGNTAVRTLVLIADTILPSIDVTSQANESFINTSRVELAGTVSESVPYISINRRIFPVVAGAWTATLGLAEGPNVLEIIAVDAAGNLGRAYLTLYVDTQLPTVILLGLPDYLVTNKAMLQVRGSVNDFATITVQGADVPLVNFEFDTDVPLAEGENLILISATDRAGNTRAIVRHVTRDTLAPALAITEPQAGATLNVRFIRIVGTTEPNSTVRVNNQLVAVDASGNFIAYVSLDVDGDNSIQIEVTDAALNAVSRTLSVRYAKTTVDTSTPLMIGSAVAAAAFVGLAIGGRFLIKRRIDGKVAEALGTPLAPPPTILALAAPDVPPAGDEAAPTPGYEGAAPPAPPRPPRPPRPPLA